MFDGRHCTKKDLNVLIKETDKILLLISSDIDDDKKKSDLINFINLIKRFDIQIGDTLLNKINNSKDDYIKIKNDISICVEELKRNIIVDIYEHN